MPINVNTLHNRLVIRIIFIHLYYGQIVVYDGPRPMKISLQWRERGKKWWKNAFGSLTLIPFNFLSFFFGFFFFFPFHKCDYKCGLMILYFEFVFHWIEITNVFRELNGCVFKLNFHKFIYKIEFSRNGKETVQWVECIGFNVHGILVRAIGRYVVWMRYSPRWLLSITKKFVKILGRRKAKKMHRLPYRLQFYFCFTQVIMLRHHLLVEKGRIIMKSQSYFTKREIILSRSLVA